MTKVSLEQLTFELFAQLLNTNFRVWIDGQNAVNLELCEVTPARVTPTAGGDGRAYENFALVFLGPTDGYLPQRLYLFESAKVGRFELFIVPVSRDEKGLRYQATFNRLAKSS